jgi:hypothetical protein
MNKWNGLRKLKKRSLAMGRQWHILSLNIFFFSLVVLSGCNKKITADAPTETYASSEIKIKESYLTAPIDIDLKEIQRQLNQNFKGLVYADSSFQGDDLKYKIWKSKELSFKHRENGVFVFDVPLRIWIEKQVKVLGITRTPTTEFEIIAHFTSKPFIASNWELKTISNAEGFDWITEPKLSFAGFTIPIAGIVGSIIDNYQTSIARMIDEKVSSEIDLVGPVLKIWNGLKEPIKLSDDYNLWLQVIPQDVLMSELEFKNNKLHTSIAIKAFVNTSVGKINTPLVKSKELPPIKFAKQLPEGFTVNLNNLVTFSEAEKIAKGMFLGKKMKVGDNREIEIIGLKIYGGAQNKLIIQVNTSGDLNGVIFLKGDPFYNEKKREIVLKNIEFDLKTKNLLAKAASWFMEGTFSREIEKSFGIPVDPIFDEGKLSLDSFLNTNFNNGLSLTGKVKDISPGDVYLKQEGMMTTVNIIGDIGVKLSSFAAKK